MNNSTIGRLLMALLKVAVVGLIAVVVSTFLVDYLIGQDMYPTRGFTGGIARVIYQVLPTSHHAYAFGVLVGEMGILLIVAGVIWWVINEARNRH